MKNEFTVSVRYLVEFVLNSGDLDLGGFTSADRAREGQRIHTKIQNSRGDDYSKEVQVSKTIDCGEFQVNLNGRIDGIITKEDELIIEEIKTIKSGLQRYIETEDPLHWGQAKVYAFIYAEKEELDRITVQLTYYELQSRKTNEVRKEFSFLELSDFFNSLINNYISWLQELESWRKIRNRAWQDLPFPFKSYRKGQKEMAVAVYKNIRSSKQLQIQAPTGIGKTAATLYPALKALAEDHSSKIFFVAARTTGKQAAVDALNMFSHQGGAVKFLVLTAKEKICFKPGVECNPNECEFAEGFYDRLAAARQEMFQKCNFVREELENTALKYRICPFEFSLEMALWSDCVIGDYNYVFDLRTKLKRFFGEDQNPSRNNFTLLVDEAHNLVDRARDMFSAELQKKDILALRRKLKEKLPGIYKSLSRINSWFLKIKKEFLSDKDNFSKSDLADELIPLLNKFLSSSEKWLSNNLKTSFRKDLLEVYFNVLWFLKIIEIYADNYTTCFSKDKNNVVIKLFCIDPARQIAAALQKVTSAVFFSATLTPAHYFKEIFGLDKSAEALTFSSPFPAENLQVYRENSISTKYKDRRNTLEKLADTIREFVARKKGNYLIFFPSYNYMQQVLEIVQPKLVNVDVLVQTNNMTEEERSSYINAFSIDNPVTTAGFAVLGGVFGEGIDLIGNRLDAAVIVSVGLPGISFERNLIRDFFNRTGKGFDYAYKYPGITRVLQAAGRVIRTETDKGEILLIDTRFRNFGYSSLLPREWKIGLEVLRCKQIVECDVEIPFGSLFRNFRKEINNYTSTEVKMSGSLTK